MRKKNKLLKGKKHSPTWVGKKFRGVLGVGGIKVQHARRIFFIPLQDRMKPYREITFPGGRWNPTVGAGGLPV